MESWVRFERWTLGVLSICWIACVSYALWNSRVKPPASGLGNPKSITRRGGWTVVAYEVPYQRPDASSSLDIRLQIKGYKRPQYTWGGFYMKSKEDYVEVFQGKWKTMPDGRRFLLYDQGTMTVTHTIRQANWSSVWQRFKWQTSKRKQTTNARMARSTYPQPFNH